MLAVTLTGLVALADPVVPVMDAATFFSAPDFGGEAISLSAGDYNGGSIERGGDSGQFDRLVESGQGISGCCLLQRRVPRRLPRVHRRHNGAAGNLKSEELQDDLTGKISSVRIYRPVIEDPAARDEKAEQEALDGWWTESMKNKDERIQWWRDARFGCFMHWGAYSVLAGEWNGKLYDGYTCHLMRMAKISLADYTEAAVEKFNPTEFNAEEWVLLIKEAGMKYLVITAKHHDGFAMYRSDAYYYDLDLTPFKRDPMMELREEARDKIRLLLFPVIRLGTPGRFRKRLGIPESGRGQKAVGTL